MVVYSQCDEEDIAKTRDADDAVLLVLRMAEKAANPFSRQRW